ncbi:unnamed protein product, partial [Mesorhabditis belari]|uniref:C-type lectin domain-containing protein n=1 Tax=Mesorhabditis belari TaxID=2138241 RepID=A0AAF3ESN8_9BILA
MNYFLKFLFIGFIQHILSCPDGSYPIVNDDECLWAIGDSIPYLPATHWCASLGAMTAKIRNIYENQFIFAMIPLEINAGLTPYIGVERAGNNTWSYADGSPLIYANWATNEPQLTNTSFCAVMNPDTAKWYSADCSTPRPFICTAVQPNTTTTTTTTATTTTTLQTTAHSTPTCSEGWTYYGNTDSCYYLHNFTFDNQDTWKLYDFQIAEGQCQIMGAHLISIHSAGEDAIAYELLMSNVDYIRPVPIENPCAYQWGWIGYYNWGNGEKGQGNWTDGSPVDYIDRTSFPRYHYRMIGNDPSCGIRTWSSATAYAKFARFICKMPAGRKLIE